MNNLMMPILVAGIGLPAAIWAWNHFQDPKEAALSCVLSQHVAIQEALAKQIGDRSRPTMAELPAMMADAQQLMEPCRDELRAWVARDGQEVAKREVTKAILMATLETTDDPLARKLMQGLLKQADAK